MKISNVEKRMTSGGANTPRIDLKEVIEIADAEKYEFDALNERLELLNEAWLEQRQPGESFDSWFKRTPREEILRITLSGGGRVGLNEGGSTASERYEAKIKELTDKGLSRELAEALIISELSPDAYRILEKKNGGRIIKFSDYHKPKRIQKINLGDYFDLGRTLSSLSRSERDTLKWLLNKSLYKKD